MEDRNYILHDIIEKIKEEYDYIIIDCPPSLNALTINAMTTADSVLVPISVNIMHGRIESAYLYHRPGKRKIESKTCY